MQICNNININGKGHLTFAGRDTLELAQKYGILPSGGSDYHGGNKPDITLGRGKGNLRIPLELLERLNHLRFK